MSYELCATASAAARAVRDLQSSSHLFVDLEGRDLGCEGGALSVISVGTALARKIYIFDVLSLHISDIRPLLNIIANQYTLKIVWDGRMDSIELRRTFRIDFGRVLDLQVADVVSRPERGAEDEERKFRDWHPLRTVCRYDTSGVHALTGLKNALTEHGSYGNSRKTDLDHTAWMNRPVSETYLSYAANDIELLSRVYALFQSRAHVCNRTRNRPELEIQSARYVRMHSSPIPKDDAFRMSNLMPLEVLSAPSGAGAVSRKNCTKCYRSLSAACFTYRLGPSPSGTSSEAHDMCKVCYLLSERRRLQEEEKTQPGQRTQSCRSPWVYRDRDYDPYDDFDVEDDDDDDVNSYDVQEFSDSSDGFYDFDSD